MVDVSRVPGGPFECLIESDGDAVAINNGIRSRLRAAYPLASGMTDAKLATATARGTARDFRCAFTRSISCIAARPGSIRTQGAHTARCRVSASLPAAGAAARLPAGCAYDQPCKEHGPKRLLQRTRHDPMTLVLATSRDPVPTAGRAAAVSAGLPRRVAAASGRPVGGRHLPPASRTLRGSSQADGRGVEEAACVSAECRRSSRYALGQRLNLSVGLGTMFSWATHIVFSSSNHEGDDA